MSAPTEREEEMSEEKDDLDELTEKSGRRPAFAGRRNMANARINPLRTCWFEFLGRKMSSPISEATQAVTPAQRS